MTGLGRYEEAEELLLGAYVRLQAETGDEQLQTQATVRRLVELYEAWGRPDQAAEYRELLTAPAP